MSSIDKGVEQVVNQLGRNVRVERRGNTIVGVMNGEVIFSMADRWGYINEAEKEIIRNGIRRYDEEQARRRAESEAERRAREEAIRRAREEAERRRIEAERQEALRAARALIETRRTELAGILARRTAAVNEAAEAARSRKNAIADVSALCRSLDFSALTSESTEAEKRDRASREQAQTAARAALAELEGIASSLSNSASAAEANAAAQRCKKVKTPDSTPTAAGYDSKCFLDRVGAIRRAVSEMVPVISKLEGLAAGSGRTAMIAKEALSHIKGHAVTSAEDVRTLAVMLEGRLEEIVSAMAASAAHTEAARLAEMQGALSAVRQISEFTAEGHYTVTDRRDEVIAEATQALDAFRSLSEAEYTSCSLIRRQQVEERLEQILAGDASGESVLRECEALVSEAAEWQDRDRRLAPAYGEYRALIEQLHEYGASSEEFGAFDPNAYTEQKQELLAAIRHERREFERSQLIITDMEARNVMEEMGYELFSTVGDAQGFVREALYTRPGYNGVLWQIVSCADGSVKRRIIGVNQGETQTDPAYILEVAEEMENEHDAEEFLRRFGEASGSQLAVTAAVDHDSEDAMDAIYRNGYHYLSGDALALYRKRTQIIRNNTVHTPAERQIRAAASSAVASTASALQEECRRQQAASNAN